MDGGFACAVGEVVEAGLWRPESVDTADDRPLADYDEGGAQRVFVHLCSAAQWAAITGEVPPPTPVDRDAYVSAGLPWFDYYDADAQDLAPSQILAKVKTVGEKLGGEDASFVPVDPKTVITLGEPSSNMSASYER